MAVNYNFEWDPKKARTNQNTHGVGFDEGATEFTDPVAVSVCDSDHGETEERWITMGISENGRLLVVVHTFRKQSEDVVTIRIISTRKASNRESQTYGERS